MVAAPLFIAADRRSSSDTATPAPAEGARKGQRPRRRKSIGQKRREGWGGRGGREKEEVHVREGGGKGGRRKVGGRGGEVAGRWIIRGEKGEEEGRWMEGGGWGEPAMTHMQSS